MCRYTTLSARGVLADAAPYAENLVVATLWVNRGAPDGQFLISCIGTQKSNFLAADPT